jgi:coenzyme F420 hydrogenase subunit beta
MAFQPVVIDPEQPLGNYIGLYLAKTRDKRVIERLGPSYKGGGAVTSILLCLLEEGVVDAVIVARRKKGLYGETRIATTPEEVLEATGPRWSIVPYTLGLREKLLSLDVSRVAFVGLPCQAQFLRQVKMFPLMETDFSKKIYLIISLFCMGTFAVESFLNYIKRSYHVEPENIENISIQGDSLIIKHTGGEITILIKDALPYLQHGCLTCPDYTGLFADLSAGKALRPGYTFLITRTELADKIVREAADKGYMEIMEPDKETIRFVIDKAREKIIRSYKYLARIL